MTLTALTNVAELEPAADAVVCNDLNQPMTRVDLDAAA